MAAKPCFQTLGLTMEVGGVPVGCLQVLLDNFHFASPGYFLKVAIIQQQERVLGGRSRRGESKSCSGSDLGPSLFSGGLRALRDH